MSDPSTPDRPRESQWKILGEAEQEILSKPAPDRIVRVFSLMHGALGRLIASERRDAARRERNRLKALLEAKLLLPAKWILDIIDALPDEETL